MILVWIILSYKQLRELYVFDELSSLHCYEKVIMLNKNEQQFFYLNICSFLIRLLIVMLM